MFGFNGKEADSEGEWGSSTVYDYGFRIYNPSIARFLSIDPLSPDYPSWTPYAFAMNRVIDGVDLDGLEYIDTDLVFDISNPYRIKISGELTVKLKLIKLTDKKVNADILEYHKEKAASTFKMRYSHPDIQVSLNPDGSTPTPGTKTTVEYAENFRVNIEFIGTYDDVSALQPGDLGILLVDDIGDVAGHVSAYGVSEHSGSVAAIEIDQFNKRNKVFTHELGHLLFSLTDPDPNKPTPSPTFLMAGDKNNDQGFLLRSNDQKDISYSLVYRRGLSQNKNYNVPDAEKKARNMIIENKLKTNKRP